VFANNSGLTSIVVADGNTVYDSRDNCNAIIETATNTLFAGCQSTVIPNSVTSIGDAAFWECTGFTSISVAEGNSKYDSRDNCNAIIEKESNKLILGCKNTIIPNNVTSIGKYAFYKCRGLTSVTIPDSVTSIGEEAFYNCYDITIITIGNSVTSIGEWAFYNCVVLNTVHNYSTLKFTSRSSNHGYIAYYASNVYNYQYI
jgi:hypothetical protein